MGDNISAGDKIGVVLFVSNRLTSTSNRLFINSPLVNEGNARADNDRISLTMLEITIV